MKLCITVERSRVGRRRDQVRAEWLIAGSRSAFYVDFLEVVLARGTVTFSQGLTTTNIQLGTI